MRTQSRSLRHQISWRLLSSCHRTICHQNPTTHMTPSFCVLARGAGSARQLLSSTHSGSLGRPLPVTNCNFSNTPSMCAARLMTETHLGMEFTSVMSYLGFIFQPFQSRVFSSQMFIGMYSEQSFIEVSQQPDCVPSPTPRKGNVCVETCQISRGRFSQVNDNTLDCLPLSLEISKGIRRGKS